MTKPRRLLLAAIVCVGATFLPLLIGFAFEFDPFKIWAVVSAYLGVSWLLPALLIGFATTEWAKERGRPHPGRAGTLVGVGAGTTLLVGLSVILVAFGVGEQ